MTNGYGWIALKFRFDGRLLPFAVMGLIFLVVNKFPSSCVPLTHHILTRVFRDAGGFCVVGTSAQAKAVEREVQTPEQNRHRTDTPSCLGGKYR